jgi:hypothetical protein
MWAFRAILTVLIGSAVTSCGYFAPQSDLFVKLKSLDRRDDYAFRVLFDRSANQALPQRDAAKEIDLLLGDGFRLDVPTVPQPGEVVCGQYRLRLGDHGVFLRALFFGIGEFGVAMTVDANCTVENALGGRIRPASP